MAKNLPRGPCSVSRADDLPLVERIDLPIDSVEAFLRLSGLPHVVFFDSAMRQATLGRYSFVAADPVEWLVVPADGTDALAKLAAHFANLPRTVRADLPPFQGGWAGLMGYELAGSLERIPRAATDEFQIPALAVGLYDVVVAFDHGSGTSWLISQGFPDSEAASRRERAAARLDRFREQLRANAAPRHPRPAERNRLAIEQLAPQFSIERRSGLTSNFSAAGYQRAVKRIIEYIYAGDVFQVNLSQRLLHAATTPPVELYCRLRERNPAPFAGYLDGGNWQVASASPERFVRVANGHVETRPIKGTRRRSPHPVADLFTGDDLRASEKDRAENVMIVDLLRNDLSRTCRPDSVRATQLCALETYQYVQHLVSVVEGTLRPECTPLDVLRTSFPGGSVTGAPKIRATEIIAELEPTVRGAYCEAWRNRTRAMNSSKRGIKRPVCCRRCRRNCIGSRRGANGPDFAPGETGVISQRASTHHSARHRRARGRLSGP
jgi:para-aminobenzoate synthetase component 1